MTDRHIVRRGYFIKEIWGITNGLRKYSDIL